MKNIKKLYFTGSDFHRRTLHWLSYSSPVPLQYKYMIYVICGLTQKKKNYLLTKYHFTVKKNDFLTCQRN